MENTYVKPVFPKNVQTVQEMLCGQGTCNGK